MSVSPRVRQREFSTGRTRVCPGQLLGTLGLGVVNWETHLDIYSLSLGVRQLGKAGTSYKVAIVHIVHIHCTYIYLYFLLTHLHPNQPERGAG